MVTNGGRCEVTEDDDKIVLSFQCGSGGRLIDDGRYDVEGGPYLTLQERAGRTFSDELPDIPRSIALRVAKKHTRDLCAWQMKPPPNALSLHRARDGVGRQDRRQSLSTMRLLPAETKR